ncbi:MAG: ABC transporter substrate-binding protein [Myxococcales bacterium]
MSVVEQRGDRRLVRHAGGETWIPARPQRVAGMFLASDDLISLGVRPVAVAANWTQELPAYARRHFDPQGVSLLGTTGVGGGTNLEQLWAASPDLILAGWPGEVPTLSRIAPTLATSYDALPADAYQQRLMELGQVLGVEERARQVLAAHQRRVAETSAVIRERLNGRTVAVLRLHARQLRLLGMRHLGFVSETLALPVDPYVKEHIPSDYFDLVSVESLAELRAGVLVVAVDSVVIGAQHTLHEARREPAVPPHPRGPRRPGDRGGQLALADPQRAGPRAGDGRPASGHPQRPASTCAMNDPALARPPTQPPTRAPDAATELVRWGWNDEDRVANFVRIMTRGKFAEPVVRKAWLDTMRGALPERKPLKVLDVGCGPGTCALLYAEARARGDGARPVRRDGARGPGRRGGGEGRPRDLPAG